MRRVDDKKDPHYECIFVYVDDLMISSKLPQTVLSALINKYYFKLKGTGPSSYHLGCDFTRDGNDYLCLAFRDQIENTSKSCMSYFGSAPKLTYLSPLEKVDHPELDTTHFLGGANII